MLVLGACECSCFYLRSIPHPICQLDYEKTWVIVFLWWYVPLMMVVTNRNMLGRWKNKTNNMYVALDCTMLMWMHKNTSETMERYCSVISITDRWCLILGRIMMWFLYSAWRSVFSNLGTTLYAYSSLFTFSYYVFEIIRFFVHTTHCYKFRLKYFIKTVIWKYSKTCLKQNLKGPEHFSAQARFPFNQGILW
jgi:hypothetical protein